jgi:hypothetical protein
MKSWKEPASQEAIDRAVAALEANGIEAQVVDDGDRARKAALAMIPDGAEVLAASSITAESIGLVRELNESGRYDAVKPRLVKMDPETEVRAMRKLGAAPDVVVGSAHALTEGGTLVIASLTGSQLPSYAYGAGTVIWIVGSQKIVKDVDEGMRRLEEHVIPLESERARKAYGLPEGFRSFPSKILLVSREVQPGRAKVIVVREPLGF